MKNFDKPWILLVIFLLCSSSLHGQLSVQQLKKYLREVSMDNSTALPSAIMNDSKNEKALLEVLYQHRDQPGGDFQFRVMDLIRLIGQKSKNQEIRMSVVNYFVRSIPDRNLRISGIASSGVNQFLKQDFSNADKDSIVSYLRVGMSNLDGLLRLAGFLEIASAKEKMYSILNAPVNTIIKWNARLALSRLGDEDATNFILEKIAASTIDDSFMSAIVPGLVYTRNKKVFTALEKFVQSDSYTCRSSHPDSRSTVLCAYRVLENMAVAIEKFPIKVDDSGDMLVDNYQDALETARKWLRQNPDYRIDRKAI